MLRPPLHVALCLALALAAADQISARNFGHVALLEGGALRLGTGELPPVGAETVVIAFGAETAGPRMLMSNLGPSEGIELEQTAREIVLRLRTAGGLETRSRRAAPGWHTVEVYLTPTTLAYVVDGKTAGLDLVSQPLLDSEVGLSFGPGPGQHAAVFDGFIGMVEGGAEFSGFCTPPIIEHGVTQDQRFGFASNVVESARSKRSPGKTLSSCPAQERGFPKKRRAAIRGRYAGAPLGAARSISPGGRFGVVGSESRGAVSFARSFLDTKAPRHPSMPWILKLENVSDRTTPATLTTLEFSAGDYRSPGGNGWSAGQYLPLIDASSIKIHKTIDRSEWPVASVTLDRLLAGSEATADGLSGVEVVGADADLRYVGDVNYPDGTTTTYTLASPFRGIRGKVTEDSRVDVREAPLVIQATPGPLTRPALRTFASWGPGVAQPTAWDAYADWETWEPDDHTVGIHFFLSREAYVAGGTQWLATDGDRSLSLVDGKLRATVAHAITEAVVDSAVLEPEAHYFGWYTYDDGDAEVELFTIRDGDTAAVSHGTDTGSGAQTKSGNTWRLGADEGTAAEWYQGVWSDFIPFESVEAEADMVSSVLQGFNGGEDAHAWAEGGMRVATSLFDSGGVDTDEGGGLVSLPTTAGQAFGTAGGNVVYIPSAGEITADNYGDQWHVLDSSTTATKLVFEATFAGITLPTSPNQAFATGPDRIFDKLTRNASSRRDATPVGCLPGTNVNAGRNADVPGSEPQDSHDNFTGTVLDRPLGIAASNFHLEGRMVGWDPFGGSEIFLIGDPRDPPGRVITGYEHGVDASVTPVTSLLELMDEDGNASYPGLALVKIDAPVDRAVTADVEGMPAPHMARALEFDGVDDYLDLGTTANSLLQSPFTLEFLLSFPRSQGIETGKPIIQNSDGSVNGIQCYLNDTVDETVKLVCEITTVSGGSKSVAVSTELARDFVTSLNVTWTVDESGGTVTGKLYVDGLEVDEQSTVMGMPGAILDPLQIGRNITGAKFMEMQLSELSLFDEVKDPTWIEQKLLENLWHRVAGKQAVQNLAGGKVGIVVDSHPWAEGDILRGDGFTNYDSADMTVDAFVADGGLTTDELVVVTATHVAETTTGSERLYDAGLRLGTHFSGGEEPQGTPSFPSGTLNSSVGVAIAATMTGAVMRSGAVSPSSPRACVKNLCLHSRPAVHGRDLDFSKTSGWVAHPIGYVTTGRVQVTEYLREEPGAQGSPLLAESRARTVTRRLPSYLTTPSTWAMLWTVLDTFEGWMRIDSSGKVVFGQHLDPFLQVADHTAPEGDGDGSGTGAGVVSWPLSHDYDGNSPWQVESQFDRIHTVEEGAPATSATTANRSRWRQEAKALGTPVPNARARFPEEGPPIATAMHWGTRAGAIAEGTRLAAIAEFRRYAARNAGLHPAWWLFGHPTSGQVEPGDYMAATSRYAGGEVLAAVVEVRINGGGTIAVDLGRIRAS